LLAGSDWRPSAGASWDGNNEDFSGDAFENLLQEHSRGQRVDAIMGQVLYAPAPDWLRERRELASGEASPGGVIAESLPFSDGYPVRGETPSKTWKRVAALAAALVVGVSLSLQLVSTQRYENPGRGVAAGEPFLQREDGFGPAFRIRPGGRSIPRGQGVGTEISRGVSAHRRYGDGARLFVSEDVQPSYPMELLADGSDRFRLVARARGQALLPAGPRRRTSTTLRGGSLPVVVIDPIVGAAWQGVDSSHLDGLLFFEILSPGSRSRFRQRCAERSLLLSSQPTGLWLPRSGSAPGGGDGRNRPDLSSIPVSWGGSADEL
jgi:hypothetical protein